MNTLRLILGFIIALVVAVVVVSNIHGGIDGDYRVAVNLLTGEMVTTTGILILIAWASGLFSYAIFALVGEIQLRTRLARSQREKDVLMRELNDLRNLPLAGEEPVADPGDMAPVNGGRS